MLRHIIISLCLVGCGTAEEAEKKELNENLDKSSEIALHGKIYRVDAASLLSKSCNRFYVNFLLDTNNSCSAVSFSSNIDYTFTINGAIEPIEYTEDNGTATWTDASGTFHCYVYNGDTYASDGTKIIGGGHMILSRKEAKTYTDMAPAQDIVLIGTSQSHCDAMK